MTKLYQSHAVLWNMDSVLVDTGNFHFENLGKMSKEGLSSLFA